MGQEMLKKKATDTPDSAASALSVGSGGERERHHIWCNYYSAGPASECEMCKRFNKSYPMDGMTGFELAAKYFPDAVARSEPNAALTGGEAVPVESTVMQQEEK